MYKRIDAFDVFFIFLIFSVRMLGYSDILTARLAVIILLAVTILCIYLKRECYILLIMFSALEFDSYTSIHNYILYYLSFVVFIFGIYKRLSLSVVGVILIIYLIYMVIKGLFNQLTANSEYIEIVQHYFYFDMKIYLVFFLSYFSFSFIGIKTEFIVKSLVIISVSYVMFVFFGLLFNMKSLLVETRGYVGYTSQLSLILAFLTSGCFLSKSYITLILLSMVLFLMIITSNVISQNVLIILMSVMFCFFLQKPKKIFLSLILLGVIIVGVSLNVSYFISDNILLKIGNISSIFNAGQIYEISHSPLVRIIEFLNVISTLGIHDVLGAGFGAYVTDEFFNFPALGKFDFTQNQIDSGKYFMLHNFNYPLLKYGSLYIFFLFYCFKGFLKNNNQEKLVIVSLLIFSSLNIGFTYFPSIAAGLLLFYVEERRNSYR